MKCFWLLSDRKTVREISHAKYWDIVRFERDHARKKLLVIVYSGEIMIRKGEHYAWIPRRQLNEVLRKVSE